MRTLANATVHVHSAEAKLEFHRSIRKREMALGRFSSVQNLGMTLANGVQHLTGFEPLCFCQVESHEAVTIIAEARPPILLSFFGKTVPSPNDAGKGGNR